MKRTEYEIRQRSAKSRITRILTLVCFFHFSGLNNGIAYFATLADQEFQAGFAPVAIEKASAVFRAETWKGLVSGRLISRCFSKSGRVIEVASQRAIRSIMIEATLFQMYVKSSFGRTADRAAAPVGAFSPGSHASGSESSVPVFEGGKLLGDPVGFPGRIREESWILSKRFLSWEDQSSGKYRFSVFGWEFRIRELEEHGAVSSGLKYWITNFVRFMRRGYLQQIHLASGRGSDEGPLSARRQFSMEGIV